VTEHLELLYDLLALLMVDSRLTERALEVLSVEAGAEELTPESFAIEAQAQGLSGPLAVKLMEFLHGLGPALCALA
jgi:hypothetical protein